jgi:tRNA(Ile)-lysidine synthase
MDPLFLRNRIRHSLMPLLASEYNAEIVENLNRTGEILRDEQIWLDSMIEPLLEKTKLPGDNNHFNLSIPELKKMPIAAARRIIRQGVSKIKGNLHGVGFKHMDAVLDLITSNNKNSQFDFPGPVRIKRENDKLVIFRQKNNIRFKTDGINHEFQQPLFEYQINGPQTVFIKEIDQLVQLTELSSKEVFCLKKSNFYATDPQEEYIDMASLCYPLIIRSFRAGDRFKPLGLKGSQKLKKFFTNNKVPFSQKKKFPSWNAQEKLYG